MQLIVDTNILAAALIRNATTRRILLSPSFEFFLPDYVLDELRENWDFILKKAKLPLFDLEQLLSLLLQNVQVLPESSYAQHIPAAEVIMSAVDIDDAPFIALALSFQNDGIRSNDRHLEHQSVIRIWKTEELLRLIEEGMIR